MGPADVNDQDRDATIDLSVPYPARGASGATFVEMLEEGGKGLEPAKLTGESRDSRRQLELP